MPSALKNVGETILELNWGDFHILLKPGEQTFTLGDSIVRKLILRNPALQLIPEDQIVPTQETTDETEEVEIEASEDNSKDSVQDIFNNAKPARSDNVSVGAGQKRRRGSK